MKHTVIIVLLTAISAAAMAQESHYHRSLRSQDTQYGLTQEPRFQGSGMYWSRTRDANDMAIVDETPADSIARREAFKRLCQLAYDAYEVKDYYRTVLYGDSALVKRYHTPDLYYFMGVSYEQLGAYRDAEWAFKKAKESGYTKNPTAYADFCERMKQRKAEEKQRKKEEKKRLKGH